MNHFVRETHLKGGRVGLRLRVTAFGLLLAAAGAGWLEGGVVPGRWEKVEAQPPGTRVLLTLRSGGRIDGAFMGSTADAIRILQTGGAEEAVPKTSVAKVETVHKVADPTGDGIAIGAGVGAIWGALAGGAGDLDRGGTTVMMGLLGAGVGYLVDKARESPETLYLSR